MKIAFFILLGIEVALMLWAAIDSSRSSGEDAAGAAYAFFLILLLSVIVDSIYGIVWLIVRWLR